MRIALLASPRFPIAEPFAGGLELHTRQLADGLSARGHEVTLFGHPDSQIRGRLVAVRAATHAGVAALARSLYGAMRAAQRGEFDLIHDNSIHFLPPLLASRSRVPVVTTLHTPPYRSHRLAGRFYPRDGPLTVVSISRFLADRWGGYVAADRVIHNGIDPENWAFSARAEPGTAVWFGRLTPEKGAEFAVRMARRAGWQLLLAGPRSDENYFTTVVAPLLGEDARYLGHLSRTELGAVIGRSAAALFTPTWEEPFGLAYLEALACGTPVVGFASGAAAEIVTPEVGTLVSKGDVEAGARVLRGASRSKDRSACRQRVVDHFTLRGMLDGYEMVYRELTAGGG